MGFFESNLFQGILAIAIVIAFGLQVYSIFKKQSFGDTINQIKEWYSNIDGDGEE